MDPKHFHGKVCPKWACIYTSNDALIYTIVDSKIMVMIVLLANEIENIRFSVNLWEYSLYSWLIQKDNYYVEFSSIYGYTSIYTFLHYF